MTVVKAIIEFVLSLYFCSVTDAKLWLVAVKMTHLDENFRYGIRTNLSTTRNLSWNLEHVRNANVLTRHCYELSDSRFLYRGSRNVSLECNNVVDRINESMIHAGVIVSPSIACPFPVVVVLMNDRKPCFCIDYCLWIKSLCSIDGSWQKFRRSLIAWWASSLVSL